MTDMSDPRDMDGMIRLVVDQEKCIGSGICEMLEEATFLIDEDTNISGVLGDGALPADRAAKVIDECPASAIYSVTEEE